MKDLYLVPMGLGILITIFEILRSLPKKAKDPRLVFDVSDAPFDNVISNKLYELSYSAPFSSMIPESSEDPKAQSLDKIFAQAGYAKKLNYRVFGVIQGLMLITALFLTFFSGAFITSNPWLIKLLFNIEVEGGSWTPYLVIGIILILSTMIPKMVFKSKAKRRRIGFIKDLPILQLFIVLMLKSKRSTAEILYTLSKTRTRYKEIFDVAYRISIRSMTESFDYLRNAFADTAFVDTITILATSEEYSRRDSIEVLEGRIENLIQDVEALKGDKSALKGLFSEGSIALPFAAVMILVVVPIIVYAMNMMNSAGSNAIQ